jgi:hypothetical protein
MIFFVIISRQHSDRYALFQGGYALSMSITSHYTENGYSRQGVPAIFKLSCKALYNMLKNSDLFYNQILLFSQVLRKVLLTCSLCALHSA